MAFSGFLNPILQDSTKTSKECLSIFGGKVSARLARSMKKLLVKSAVL
jgi:hypothetical protein